jgi:hypothetical protein
MCDCRGTTVCEHCDTDVCACQCEIDGAPQTQESVTTGWTPATTHFEKATR